ncbi:hypothetical protein AB0I54_06585 [Streptomyces sp. NPDC050625]|uniref:hypothetical protein n=1 Tax=Streptomyces sp. NPDC050625 TaxID=3154629 RepID=UPI0034272D77
MSNIMSAVHIGSACELLVIFARAAEGRQEEFVAWYDTVHVPEVLAAFPELTEAVRYDISDIKPHSEANPFGELAEGRPFDSVAVYRVHGSAREVWARIRTSELTRSDAFDYSNLGVLFATA